MKKVAGFIVNNSKLMFVLFMALLAWSVWGMTQVNVEYDIAHYLPQETDTRKAISIMEDEFTTFGTTSIMIRNVPFEKAKALHDEIEDMDGVKSFTFENTLDYYKDSCALFNITFDGDDEVSVNAYNKIIDKLDGYDYLVSTKLVDTYADDLARDVLICLSVVVVIIIAVLLFTQNSVAVIPVFLLTFGAAALLNMGTNYLFGTISFISNSVCVILQLALAIDYAIILDNRFQEEKERNGGNVKEALTEALAKAIVEISSSSLTTIAGLLALTTMSLKLGEDMGLVLAKSIICSMITVFIFMPCLLLFFSKWIQKTTHKNLVPKVDFIGKFSIKFRFIIMAVFVALISVSAVFSFKVDYVYSTNTIATYKPTESQQAQTKIDDVFGAKSQFVILTEGKNFDEQKEILDFVKGFDGIGNALGLANTELKMNGQCYNLTEKINYKQFADLLRLDDNIADSIFSSYAMLCKDSIEDQTKEVALYRLNKMAYKVSLLDLCDCAIANGNFIEAYLDGDEDLLNDYRDLRDTITDAEDQLIGENYSRLIFEINGKEESEETFSLISKLLVDVKAVYPTVIFAGSSMSAYDLKQSFSNDNLKVSIISILAVFVILIFTFKSWGIPIPLVITIQGAIFINFASYAMMGSNLYFFINLIVSAIQMGATIDYAIVITNRFQELKTNLSKRDAIIQSVSESFPTVLTSGAIMIAAGLFVGLIVADPLISTLGFCLMRGVIISILSVLFALPSFLYIFNKSMEKTRFKEIKKPVRKKGKLKLIRQDDKGNVEEVL